MARAEKATLDAIAVEKPSQEKDSSVADARATPPMMGRRARYTGNAYTVPETRKERAAEEDGLQRLDGVGEGHGDGGKGDVGKAVAEGVEEGGKGHRLEELLIRLLVLHQTGGPEEGHDQQTNREVHGGDEPGEGEVVVDLLVDDVELDVEPVPEPEVARSLERGVLRQERRDGVRAAERRER